LIPKRKGGNFVMTSLGIVVPDGSMNAKVRNLFERAGIPITIEDRTDEGNLDAPWIRKVDLQRPEDIPRHLKNRHYDIGIVGEDWLADCGCNFPILLSMAMGRSKNQAVRIVLAVPEISPIADPYDLPRKCKVHTEYVRLARHFFNGIDRSDVVIVRSPGKTETKPRYYGGAVIDITETGKSIKANGLKIIHTLMESNTVVVARPQSLASKTKKPMIDWFVRLIAGAYQASQHMLIEVNLPKKLLDSAAQIMGGLKGPTRSPLHFPRGWFALKSVILRSEWDKISYDLIQIGVTDILPTWDIPCIMS
jgi:ATP phosphoribosyltransferase